MNVTISLHVLPAVIAFITAIVIFMMFSLIYTLSLRFPDTRAHEARALGLLCLGSAIYLLGQILLNDNQDPLFAVFWHRFQHIGLILIAPAYINFVYLYVNRKKDFFYYSIMLVSGFSLVVLYTTNLFISSEPYRYMGKYLQGKEGPLYIIFGVTLIACLSYGYYLLIRKYLSDKKEYHYDRIMIIGVGIAAFLGIHDILSVGGCFLLVLVPRSLNTG